MHTNLAIREIALPDFTGWKSLWEEFNAHFDRAVEHAVTDRIWNRFFEINTEMKAIVAERSGELIGFAHFGFHRTTDALADSCYLQDLFTRENDRSHGVGRALVDAVREAAAHRGSTNVYFETPKNNLLGTELFDRISASANSCIYRLRIHNRIGKLSSVGAECPPAAAKAATA